MLENVEDGGRRDQGACSSRYNEVAEQMATDDYDALLAEMGELQEQLDHRNAWDLDTQLEQAMDALRCPPPRRRRHGPVRWRAPPGRAVQAAASQPDLLLLDEPTNHLDAESVQWLEQHLEKYPGTVVAVTHDRYFLDNVAQWILELDRGRAYPYEGNYSTYLETKAEPAQGRGREGPKRRSGSRTSWSGCGPTRRPARPRASRGCERYEEMAAEAEKTRKLDFEEIQIPPGPRLGNIVVEAAT